MVLGEFIVKKAADVNNADHNRRSNARALRCRPSCRRGSGGDMNGWTKAHFGGA